MQIGSLVRVGPPFNVALPGVYSIVGVSVTGAWQIATEIGIVDFAAEHLILET